jgi:hypothetical protein
MYPAHIFSLFPPFPRDNKVFVAMSFEPRFDPRWRDVIAPAVGRIRINDKPLEPIRVDTRKISNSILTEILSGIGNSRLILADVTTIGHIDGKPIRNGNVMYEVGLAQAVRLPEEVVLFRSDEDSLLFDTSTIRVNFYSPDIAPEEAKRVVADTLLETLRELDLQRHLAVRKVVEMLDYPSWLALVETKAQKGLLHPKMKTMGDILGNTGRARAISRLLEIGAIRTKFIEITPERLAQLKGESDFELLKYEFTEFGNAVFHETANQMNMLSPDMMIALQKQQA